LASACEWLDALPERAARRGRRQRGAGRDAGAAAALGRRQWHERGVALRRRNGFAWADRPTALRPPHDGPHPGFVPGTVTEIHPQAEAFVRTLAERWARRGLLHRLRLSRAEYYHPQRTGGTLMCHRAHRADADPLADVGDKDITAHVNFSAIALAGQDAGLDVLGYTSQARFLLNCGLLERLLQADLRSRAAAQAAERTRDGRAVQGHRLRARRRLRPVGFAAGDRMHTL
jgi:SAM-dependent MidA family methyltransferase